MTCENKRVAVVAPTWIGDAVMSLPLIGYLGAARRLDLTVVARGYAARVYLGLDEVSDLVVLGAGGRAARIREQARLFRRLGIEAAAVLPPSFSSALGPFLGGVAHRAGVASDGRGPLLNTFIGAEGRREEHLSATYVTLGRLLTERLGISGGYPAPRPPVRVFEPERASVSRILERAGVRPGGYAVIVPGATYGPTKSWPREKYGALVHTLAEEIPVVLGGSPPEKALCAEVGGGAPNVFNLAGATSLGEFMALLEGARVVIANDSGAPHIAASMGVPVVAIFGSTSPTWTAPLGPEVHVIYRPVHCSPCFLRECPTQLECYAGISVADVANAARGALKKSVEKAPRA